MISEEEARSQIFKTIQPLPCGEFRF